MDDIKKKAYASGQAKLWDYVIEAKSKGFNYLALKTDEKIVVTSDLKSSTFKQDVGMVCLKTLDEAKQYMSFGFDVIDCRTILNRKVRISECAKVFDGTEFPAETITMKIDYSEPQNKKNMGLTKETSLKIYNCYQQIDACDDFKKRVVKLIDQQKKKADECNEPIPANVYTRYGRGCQMGIPDGGSTTSMTIFGISHELALLVIDEHRKKLVQDLEELQRIAVREQSADFSRNARLFKLLSDHRFQFTMKGVSSFYTYSEKELIGKLADEIGYTWVWACNIYDRAEALKDDAIDRIVLSFESVNREWLAEGTGEMFIK